MPFMICFNCNTPNRDQANFCKHCGTLLVQNCPRCNSALSNDASFCDHCGLRLVDSSGLFWQAARLESPRAQRISPTQPVTPPREATAPAPIPPSAPAKPEPRALHPATSESRLEQYIPQELKAKLDAARTSGEMVGERKQVTVLFSDIVNSTALAEKMDPEEWGEIVSGAHRRVSEAVYRYEGTIAQLLGDGVLAFFGAPITHEDDPVRAVHAALDILKQIRAYRDELLAKKRVPDFEMRIGLNTGLVVVGNIGTDLHMEYLAIGDAINLAARMEQTAQPGTVQIAPDTHKQVKSFFELEDLGGIEVKGKREPVPAYRVLGRKESAARPRGIEGLHAEMVGREQELLTLRGIITDLKQGVGRIVCVLGEAGLGKTRLVSEAHKAFNELGNAAGKWYETTSLSYETNQAYGLFQHLIRRVSEIGYEDPPRIVREKLASLVEGVAEERRASARQLFDALFGLESETAGAPLDSETFKRELCLAMRDWWRARFSQQPTVLVFDDMHWSDASSIETLRQLLVLTEEIPLVVMCVLRSERQSPGWQIKVAADTEYQHRYTEVALRPLSDAESNELLNRLLAMPELPTRLRASILEKSGGNPFFIEEVVRTLIDSGAVIAEERTVNGVTRRVWKATSAGADFAIPDNLQSLLAARMDRLEDATRATLQIASVIGRSFYRRVLQLVDEASQDVDKHLGTLIRLEMIREAARVPELEYAFRNPLTQEAVYKTILLKRRRAFHRRVGEVMETLFAERLEGLYGLLAYHFTQAGERAKAIVYARQAAQQAVAVYAYDEAIQNLRHALELIEPGDQTEIHLGLIEELADVYRLVRDFAQAIALYRQALDLSREMKGDKIIVVRLHRKIIQSVTDAKWSVDAAVYRQVSEIRMESRAQVEENLRTLTSAPPHPETVQLLTALSIDAWRNQTPPDWDIAQRFAQSAVEMAEQLDDAGMLSKALGALANVLDGRSLLREHLDLANRRLEISRAANLGDARESIDALRGVGVALMYFGEYAQALPYLAEAENDAARIQATEQQVNTIGIQAHCLFRLDRWDAVLATEERWRDLERRYSRERVGET
ncbi:MAG: AAA family ATPase [Chloroflexi bacterium]|nr:AAA family ATPase [Chloroflexota bacterium]